MVNGSRIAPDTYISLHFQYAENMRQLCCDPNPSKFNSISIGRHEIPELRGRYADDMVFLSTTPTGLGELTNAVKVHGKAQNL